MDYWEDMYEELKQFQKEHGHTNVSRSDPKTSKLGRWVYTQRAVLRTEVTKPKHCKIREEKMEKLKAIGFNFGTHHTKTDWNDMYKWLRKYREEHGHCNPSKHDPKVKKLALWVVKQRVDVKKFHEGKQTTMNQFRIDKLKEIDFYFNGHKHKSIEKSQPKLCHNAGENDVLLGGGGGSFRNHKGNLKFRNLVEEYKQKYKDFSINEKHKVGKEVVLKWRALDPPGRFLMRREEFLMKHDESGGGGGVEDSPPSAKIDNHDDDNNNDDSDNDNSDDDNSDDSDDDSSDDNKEEKDDDKKKKKDKDNNNKKDNKKNNDWVDAGDEIAIKRAINLLQNLIREEAGGGPKPPPPIQSSNQKRYALGHYSAAV